MGRAVARRGLLLTVTGSLLISIAATQNLEIEFASREISLVTQVTQVGTKFTVKNVGKQAVDSFETCHLATHMRNAAVYEVIQGDDDDDSPPLQLSASPTGEKFGVSCFSAQLQQPLQPGKSTQLKSAVSFTRLQTPLPASIFQNEAQRVLYEDNLYILSPYKTLKQTTRVKLPSKKIESYAPKQHATASQSSIKFGEFQAVGPFTLEGMRLHFENNTPFAVATKLIREVEISHWGNVYVEEQYAIQHTGAKIRGEWSRLELMRDPGTYGQTAIRGFLAHLPPGAHSIYFKDAIGNISTSQIRPGMQSTEVILTPRYPLYGGWKAEFVLGYSLPLQDVVQKIRSTEVLAATFLFGSALAGVTVDEIENRVVLPEGSAIRDVHAPFLVEESRDKKFTYLDTGGRPVAVVSKRNIVFEHNTAFAVHYAFSWIHLLQEPLLLIGVFLILFAAAIGYCRCDFVLTRGPNWEAEERAERAAFLVDEITTIISGRERQVLAASGDSSQDVSTLLEKLKHSEEKLNSRCRDLEKLAGPAHSSNVRNLLEKEKAVQSRISQIANAKTQSLQNGANKQEAAQQAVEGLKGVSASLKQEHASNLGHLT